MTNATTRERRLQTRFDSGYWNEFLLLGKRSQSAIWYAFEPETRVCRDDKRKVVLKRLYNVSQKKQNPETIEWCDQVVGCVTIIIFIFHEVWLICFRMIHNWNSSNHASLSSIVFKIECQNPFVPLSGTCRQGNCYNRSPMWPSLALNLSQLRNTMALFTWCF